MTNDTPLLQGRDRTMWQSLFFVLGASVLVALSAQVEVPMLPVPMSLQTLAVSVVGLTLGSRLGAAALVAYLVQGSMGLPVFSGGDAGAHHLLGPTGGFLLAYPAMAFLTGWLAERGMARGLGRTFVAALLPAFALFVPGVAWLWAVTPLDLGAAMMAGMVPFVFGDVVKSALAALVVAGGWSASRH